MNSTDRLHYSHIYSGGTAYHKQDRGLISVHGGEAVQFLDGLISNDVKTLEDGGQIRAAFPNSKGRLIAIVRVVRLNDRFYFETEAATRKAVFDNLFRFTMAGDFFVEDVSETFRFVKVYDRSFIPITPPFIEFDLPRSTEYFVHREDAFDFLGELKYLEAAEISDELYETLRIESGSPKFGVDMDETTIVPELGIDDLISYTKGCYIGQEIIARIHFRGHVAKKLTGIKCDESETAGKLEKGSELTTADGKNAGTVTSVTRSPKLKKIVAMAYVRYDYLESGTRLLAGGSEWEVTDLPFV
jgi:folate-binding protein YgfZ